MIAFFAQFLLKLATTENVSVTKMGLDNLAIVFSPGFLRCLVPDLPLLPFLGLFLSHVLGVAS